MAVTIIGTDQGGTGFQSFALGDLLYGNTDLVKLSGNTTTTRKFLRQTGTGVVSAAPVWDTVTNSDVGLGSVENTALSTWAGTTNITTVGTIATGTWNATAIGVTKGGTGLTSATLGDLHYGSASNTISALAGNTSTRLKILSQTGTGSVSAAPAWVAPTWVLLGSVAASSQATVDFVFTSWTNTDYFKYRLEIANAAPATNNVASWIRTSADGAAWDSGATNYAYCVIENVTGTYSTGDTKIPIGGSSAALAGSGSNQSSSGYVELFNPSDSKYCKIIGHYSTGGSDGYPRNSTFTAHRSSAAAVKGIRFMFSSGNIASGEFRLYGMSNT